jgi:hypothetical protein
MDCLGVRNCDLFADVAALEGLARQAAMLVRLGPKRRTALARTVGTAAQPEAAPPAATAAVGLGELPGCARHGGASGDGTWRRGRLPNMALEPLERA